MIAIPHHPDDLLIRLLAKYPGDGEGILWDETYVLHGGYNNTGGFDFKALKDALRRAIEEQMPHD